MKRLRLFLLVMLLVFTDALQLRDCRAATEDPAQNFGDMELDLPVAHIRGIVTSEKGPVAGAIVVLKTIQKTEGMPASLEMRADAKGRFLFLGVKVGHYELLVGAPGFILPKPEILFFDGKSAIEETIVLQPGKITFSKMPLIRVDRQEVYFVTDREPTPPGKSPRFFANNRSQSQSLSFGYCEVTLPEPDPRVSAAQEQQEIQEYGSDGLVFANVHSFAESRDAFQSRIQQERIGRSALLYIHGFKTSFEDAVITAATLKHDLHFEGPVVVYSWPSRDLLSRSGYVEDGKSVLWTTATTGHFRVAIKTLLGTPGIKRVNLLSHSMGARVAEDEVDKPGVQNWVGKVVFAAPDEEVTAFQKKLNTMGPGAQQVTLYTSITDTALLLSDVVNQTFPRAGQAIQGLPVQNLDTVDATVVDTTLPGHSYFVQSDDVELDIKLLLQGGAPPRCCLRRHGRAWILIPRP